MSELPLIALSQRVLVSEQGERRDALAQDWSTLCARWKLTPLPVPNLCAEPGALLARLRVRALILSGGNDPVHALTADSPALAPERDRCERLLIEAALARSLPVLGVCRGAQLLNLYFGGGLARLPAGHRHAGSAHDLLLQGIWSGRACVNSYHDLCIPAAQLAAPLKPVAFDDEGRIEAFVHDALPVLGVLWHPERAGAEDPRLEGVLLSHLLARDAQPTESP